MIRILEIVQCLFEYRSGRHEPDNDARAFRRDKGIYPFQCAGGDECFPSSSWHLQTHIGHASEFIVIWMDCFSVVDVYSFILPVKREGFGDISGYVKAVGVVIQVLQHIPLKSFQFHVHTFKISLGIFLNMMLRSSSSFLLRRQMSAYMTYPSAISLMEERNSVSREVASSFS